MLEDGCIDVKKEPEDFHSRADNIRQINMMRGDNTFIKILADFFSFQKFNSDSCGIQIRNIRKIDPGK